MPIRTLSTDGLDTVAVDGAVIVACSGDATEAAARAECALRVVDEASEPLAEMTRLLPLASPERRERALQIVDGLLDLSEIVACELDDDPAAGAGEFRARLQLSGAGLDLVAALGAGQPEFHGPSPTGGVALASVTETGRPSAQGTQP